MNNLSERQAEMRERNSRKKRPGPKVGTKWKKKIGKATAFDYQRVKRRLVAIYLLRRGWSLGDVAKEIGVPTKVMRDWVNQGCQVLPQLPYENNDHYLISKLRRLRGTRYVEL